MRRWITVAAALVVLVGMLTGCVNVKPPDGPYVQWNSSSAESKPEVRAFEDLLKQARDDGLINQKQYRELKKRLDKQFED